ncbi:hypothetical protein NDU88_010120 [Pleurodeles waltl]|uniref:Uncharacterized protein n=1 Tax=Pleurodeles waltl TaxID=8319 RepID=A0AAV7RYA6_PLEWA|nr:hypothetical protein NDU88_010120 [Pleurodeles waltl]
MFSRKVFWGATSPLRPPAIDMIPPPREVQGCSGVWGRTASPGSRSAQPLLMVLRAPAAAGSQRRRQLCRAASSASHRCPRSAPPQAAARRPLAARGQQCRQHLYTPELDRGTLSRTRGRPSQVQRECATQRKTRAARCLQK